MKTKTSQDHVLIQVTTALTQAARAYKAAADKLSAQFGLSQATAWPAVVIGRHGKDGIRPGSLAETLGLEASSVVRVIDHLIKKGLVERHEDPNDRRARILHLTADGKQRVAKIEEALIPFRRKMLENAEPSDLDACLRVINALSTSIKEYDGSIIE